MDTQIQSQRKFLMIVAFAMVAFGAMAMFFTQARATGNETNPAGEQTANGATDIGTGAVAGSGNYQEVYIRALGTGQFDNPTVTVKKGMPVRVHFSADKAAGCGSSLIIPAFKMWLLSVNCVEQIAVFTPRQEGTFEYSCSMRMFRGKMVVTA